MVVRKENIRTLLRPLEDHGEGAYSKELLLRLTACEGCSLSRSLRILNTLASLLDRAK